MSFYWKLNLQKEIVEKHKLLLADRLYIPTHLVRIATIKKAFEKYIYKQQMCVRCPVYRQGERYSEESCKPCDGFIGFFKTWGEVTIGNEDYYAVPSGDLDYVEQQLSIALTDYEVVDHRSDVKAKHPLTFTGKLYTGKELRNGAPSPNQRQLLKTFYKHKRGVINAAPRFGKTACAVHIVCTYKRKVLYIAHEKQLLVQFYKSLLNFTNLRELRKLTGNKIAGIIENDKDWEENWDINITTYQQFITDKGFNRLKKYVINKSSVLIVDEMHRSGARAYSNFISKLNMKYKIGMSATIERKDGIHEISKLIMGPVVASSTTEAMKPEVHIVYTPFRPKRSFRGKAAYVYANQWLANLKERKIMIVKQIFKDLRENPKHSIVIPVMFTNQIRSMVKLINEQAIYNNKNKGEKWAEDLAVPYYDDKKKQQSYILDEARKADRVRVLIGIRKMIKEGIDVPAWTHMYLTFPMNNQPDFYQMTQRISTPYEGKPQPILRMFVDPLPLSEGCFVATYHHIQHYKYTVSEDSKPHIKAIFEARSPKKKDDVEDF